MTPEREQELRDGVDANSQYYPESQWSNVGEVLEALDQERELVKRAIPFVEYIVEYHYPQTVESELRWLQDVRGE